MSDKWYMQREMGRNQPDFHFRGISSPYQALCTSSARESMTGRVVKGYMCPFMISFRVFMTFVVGIVRVDHMRWFSRVSVTSIRMRVALVIGIKNIKGCRLVR